MATVDQPFWPWAASDPADWVRTWQSALRLAPQNLVQPILPGWTFNINSNNSSAPQTEADVVATHSYGRQLGRISDALAALIAERDAGTPTDKRYTEFLKMKGEIDVVKREAAQSRVEQLKSDLMLLKSIDPTEYKRLEEALRKALDL
jgi:hypothetical protein